MWRSVKKTGLFKKGRLSQGQPSFTIELKLVAASETAIHARACLDFAETNMNRAIIT